MANEVQNSGGGFDVSESNAFYDEARARLNALAQRQDSMMSFMLGDRARLDDINIPLIGCDDFQLPKFEMPSKDILTLKDMPSFDGSVFAEWRKADLPVMFVTGILGGLASYFLRDFFASLHDHWGNDLTTLEGGHGGESADWVPGASRPGGFGHRWKFGHDLLNPFEIDWKSYMDLAKESGTALPLWMKAGFYWVRHLLQDTFSKEGLPLPGHSLFRWLFDASKPAQREMIQFLLTIKMRDIAGAGVTNALMGSYLWATEKSLSRVVIKANYRAFSLMAGANLTTILTGLFIPPPATSLNWGALPVLGYYIVRILLMERRIHKELNARDLILAENEATLLGNLATIAGDDATLKRMIAELDEIDRQVQKYYHDVNDRQDALAKEILGDTI